MYYLPYLNSASTEITMEKLDRVTNSIGEKIKQFAKIFFIVLGWCAANLIVALFFNRTRSVSLDTYRLISDSLREVSTLDCSVYVAFLFEGKVNCVITLAVLFVCGGGYAHLLASAHCDKSSQEKVRNCTKYTQRSVQCDAYVVSYKQQVAFLA